MIDYTDIPLSPIQKVILKDYPEWDINRHYWREGDIIEFNENFVVLCIRNGGFEKDEWMVIKGFNKGAVLEINIEDTPYLHKDNYNEEQMLELCKKYMLKKEKMLYQKGDILLDKDTFLLCVTDILDDYDYYAFVIDEKDRNFYKHSKICLYNPYKEYISKAN